MLQDSDNILLQRAKDLAAPLAAGNREEETISVLAVRLAHEEYAILSSFVREVHPLRHFSPVPCTPKFILGVVNLRSEVVSLTDLRYFFELPWNGLTNLNKVIIVQDGTMRLGLVVDECHGFKDIPASAFHKRLPTFTDRRVDYISSVGPGPLLLLDMETILADPRLQVRDELVS